MNTETNVPLTSLDRCDRCGAQAYIRYEMNSGGELLFCGHHGREYRSQLVGVATKVTDETQKLEERPPAASSM